MNLEFPEPRNEAERLQQQALHQLVQGESDKAEALLSRALVHAEALEGETETLAAVLGLLGDLAQLRGAFEQAEVRFRRAIAVWERAGGAEIPQVVSPLSRLAKLCAARGDDAEAEALLRRALEICERSLGGEDPRTAKAQRQLAAYLQARGRHDEAAGLIRTSQRTLGQMLSPVFQAVASVMPEIEAAAATLSPEECAELEPTVRRAILLTESLVGHDHPGLIPHLEQHASVLRKLGRDAEATEAERRARGIRESSIEHAEFESH